MQIFEILSLANILIFLIAVNFNLHPLQFPAFLSGIVLLIIYSIFEKPRWQMIPASIVFVLCTILLFVVSEANLLIQVLVGGVGILALVLSLLLVTGIPRKRLPEPSGSYPVGCVTKTYTVESRKQFIQIWYPASATGQAVRKLWQQLYEEGSTFPSHIQFLSRFLSEVKTHSHQDASIQNGHFPIIYYQHGLVSFTSENTLLMEALASHGYIVVSSSFVDHFDEYTQMMSQAADNDLLDDATLKNLLLTASTRAERSDIMLAYVKSDSRINSLVKKRVDDGMFIVQNLRSILPDFIGQQANFEKIGMMGYSLGGAVTFELCKSAPVLSAGLNLDGAHYGEKQSHSLSIPFLSFSKELTSGTNDFVMESSKSDFIDITVKNTQHVDFNDQAFLFPIMKWLGQSGSINASRMIEIRNSIVCQFFDYYLKQAAEFKVNSNQYPELDVVSQSG